MSESAAWADFRRPLVRDLAFVLSPQVPISKLPDAQDTLKASPIELAGDDFWQEQLTRYLPRLRQLDQDPRQLNRHIARVTQSPRLGYRFEALIGFWLADTNYHDFRLIHQNLIIKAQETTDTHKKNQTLGELDFVVENVITGEVEHWELSVKFYLAVLDPQATLEDNRLAAQDPSNWVGLNRNDTLQKKLDHLALRQFRYQQARGLKIDKNRLFLKGRFFWPDHLSDQLAVLRPDWLSLTAQLGVWRSMSASDRSDILQGTLIRTERLEWFTPRLFWHEFSRRHGQAAPSLPHQIDGTPRSGLYWQERLSDTELMHEGLNPHWLILKSDESKQRNDITKSNNLNLNP